MTTVLVIGATGHVGRPVAEALVADGRRVRLLVRDRSTAQYKLGANYDYVEGSIDDKDAVKRALDGCDGVHVSVAGATPTAMMAVEAAGTSNVATAAAPAGVRLISYLSGNLVREEYGPKLPEHLAKMKAEDALRESGVPHVIFRPTYFMENLPRHVQGKAAVTIGRPKPLHMVAAADFGAMVSRAFDVSAVAGNELAVHGPEALTIQQALRIYRDVVRPDLFCITVPLPVMALVDRLFMRGELAGPLQLMRLLERIGEAGDPTATNRLLGIPTTTVREWRSQRRQSLSSPTTKGAGS